jgi:hypothetical protein
MPVNIITLSTGPVQYLFQNILILVVSIKLDSFENSPIFLAIISGNSLALFCAVDDEI